MLHTELTTQNVYLKNHCCIEVPTRIFWLTLPLPLCICMLHSQHTCLSLAVVIIVRRHCRHCPRHRHRRHWNSGINPCCVEAEGRSEDHPTECVSSAEVRRIRPFAEYLNFRGRRFDESEMSREHSKPDAGLPWGHLPLFRHWTKTTVSMNPY